MRQDFFEFTPTHKLFIATNHRPVIRGTDHAIWRRLRLVPFTVTIPTEEQDHHLGERLADELPGILRWAVEGCLRWQKNGLSCPAAVRVATSDYRAEMDVIGAFLADECVVVDGASVPADALRTAYERWCAEQGEHVMTAKAVGLALTDRAFERRRHGGERRWHWFGFGLLDPARGEPIEPMNRDFRFNGRTRTREREEETGVPMGSRVLVERGPERLPYRDGGE
jgi:putative DNA primase/helicase